MLGEERSKAIEFVASDMWKAFLKVVRQRCSAAIHVLDRFHIAQLLSKAIDTVRREEVRSLRAAGRPALLTKTRWVLLKRRENRTTRERGKLRQLVRLNLRSVRACLLAEQFQHFWTYVSPTWAGKFLDRWTTMVMRSRLTPFKVFARTLRSHRVLLLNWFLLSPELFDRQGLMDCRDAGARISRSATSGETVGPGATKREPRAARCRSGLRFGGSIGQKGKSSSGGRLGSIASVTSAR